MSALLVRRERGAPPRPGRSLVTTGVVLLGLIVIAILAAPWLSRNDPAAMLAGAANEGPSSEHWLGTDRYGRDVATRVLYGGRATLLYTGATMLAVVIIGTVVGAAVASAGQRVDRLGRKVIDALTAFPTVIVVFAFVGLYGPSLTTVLGGAVLVWWAPFARLSRSLVRAALADPSAVAARALGAGWLRLLWGEVWPRLRGPLMVLVALETAQFVTVVAGLSFLGFGVQPPTAEWGAMLADARGSFNTDPHLLLAPAGAVLLTALALTLIGEGLRDRLDRSSQEVRT